MLWAVRLTDVWLQNRAYTLFCVFTVITQVCTGALLISQPCYTQAHCLDLHKQKVKLATWEMMFSVIQKKKLKIEVCDELLFSSFIMANDITVQLLVSVVAVKEGERPGRVTLLLGFHLSKLNNCQVQILNNMVPLHRVLLPFYSNFVLFYQHYQALLYVHFLFLFLKKIFLVNWFIFRLV